ncbi:hypothetical protein THII_2205 [Thioploca ingrica]|uniref:Carrier domain-containing protein n=1 Tax=Thioploca ingrica TaxID=40754 RepID=A0A090AL57_9GAMM|nr:hypothetical protein THII_2205 [Thioploca ingrica]
MPIDEIKEKLKDFMVQFISNINISDDESIFTSGLVNSLFAMQLVLFMEKEFQFKVEDNDLHIDNFKTLNAMSGFVERKLG